MDGKASSVGRGTWAAVAVFLLVGLPVQAKYGGGSGTGDDPYLIGTAEQMNAIGLSPEDWDKHLRLVTDIDLKELSGSVFHPVALFSGVFDGDGHTIANLTLAITGAEDTSGSNVIVGMGLFGSIKGPEAAVKNLGLVNPEVRPTFTCPRRLWCVGALAGRVSSGSIRNCYVEGGLVGWNMKEDHFLLWDPVVKDCYARGNVQGKNVAGGLIGSNQKGAVMRCYATGQVRGQTDDSLVSGLVCTNDPALVKSCFWDTEISGLSTSDGGTGKTTAEMQSLSTYLTAGWDFVGEPYNGTEDVWVMSSGQPAYPKLAWEQTLGEDASLTGGQK